ATSTLPTRLLTDNKRPRICEIDPSQVFRESPASWSRQACSPRPEGRSVLQPDQRRHTPGATVAAIGKELLGLPDGAEAAAVNRLHPDPLQALPGQGIQIRQPATPRRRPEALRRGGIGGDELRPHF